jgi:hypothetical protein
LSSRSAFCLWVIAGLSDDPPLTRGWREPSLPIAFQGRPCRPPERLLMIASRRSEPRSALDKTCAMPAA